MHKLLNLGNSRCEVYIFLKVLLQLYFIFRMKQEMKRANLYKTYSTTGSNVQAYYRPVTIDQSENNATCWDMSLVPPNQMTLLSDKCTCPTLQMRNQGDKTEGEIPLERQSLYSSIRST